MNDAILQQDEDAAWRADGEANGWILPKPAIWPLRLWGFRHIRVIWLDHRVHRWASVMGSVGMGIGQPTQRDLWVLYAVQRGFC